MRLRPPCPPYSQYGRRSLPPSPSPSQASNPIPAEFREALAKQEAAAAEAAAASEASAPAAVFAKRKGGRAGIRKKG